MMLVILRYIIVHINLALFGRLEEKICTAKCGNAKLGVIHA